MVHIGTSPHAAIQTINTFEQTTTRVHTNKKKTKQQSPHRANRLAQH